MKPEESALRKYAEDLLAGDMSQIISMRDYDHLELMARRSAHEFEATTEVYGLPAYYFRVSSDQGDYYTAATLPIGGQAQLTRQPIPSVPGELEPQTTASPTSTPRPVPHSTPAGELKPQTKASPEPSVNTPLYPEPMKAEPVKTLKTHQQRKELLALRIHELYTTTDMDDIEVRHQTDYRIVFGNKTDEHHRSSTHDSTDEMVVVCMAVHRIVPRQG